MIDMSIIGKRFGRLVVSGFANVTHHRSYWLCKCDCGTETVVSRGSLTKGDTVSCGCYHREHAHEFSFKHGMTGTKLYSVWSGIVQRCTNPKADNYVRYGGRGICICNEWREDFRAFAKWATDNGYSEGMTIDRIDNNGNYCPENCRWVDRKTQQNNRRNNNYVEYGGVTHTIAEWSRILHVNHETLRYRVNHGNFSDFITGGETHVGTQEANTDTAGA